MTAIDKDNSRKRDKAVSSIELDLKAIGDRMKSIRQELGMNQTQIAEALGTSQSMVSQYERGIEPPLTIVVRLADLGGKSLEWMVFGESQQP